MVIYFEGWVSFLELLEKRILAEGRTAPGDILSVDNFVNHLIDVEFINECGKEFYRLFGDSGITKILTIEASGIGIACLTALGFGVPVLFAKKAKSANVTGRIYCSKVHSYTHGNDSNVFVSQDYLLPTDRVLIIDDFLAKGSALEGLIDIVNQSGATLVGAGVLIEKEYQGGGNIIRERGIRVESLAKIASLDENGITFCS
jgi:xanthine phosphoribosyltransferase